MLSFMRYESIPGIIYFLTFPKANHKYKMSTSGYNFIIKRKREITIKNNIKSGK